MTTDTDSLAHSPTANAPMGERDRPAPGIPLPLTGVRVLDLGHVFQGPYATFLMAMAGADVIKIEPPHGEMSRRRGRDGDYPFRALNGCKRGIVLNLKTERGRELLIELSRKADVLVENFAPSVMTRLGLGPDVLLKANPRLIYASGSGFGRTGPYADKLALDLTIQAMSGVMSATGETGAVGSTHYQILRSYLRQYGLNPDKDVRLIGIAEPSALVSGLEQRRFDAIAYASPLVEHAIPRGAGQVWISGPRGDIPGSDNIKTGLIVVRAETLEKNREQVDALRAALTDALRVVQSERVATGQTLHKMYFANLEGGVWETAWNAITTAYPANLAFTREAYEYWITNDTDGAESYRNVDYKRITYDRAQSP